MTATETWSRPGLAHTQMWPGDPRSGMRAHVAGGPVAGDEGDCTERLVMAVAVVLGTYGSPARGYVDVGGAAAAIGPWTYDLTANPAAVAPGMATDPTGNVQVIIGALDPAAPEVSKGFGLVVAWDPRSGAVEVRVDGAADLIGIHVATALRGVLAGEDPAAIDIRGDAERAVSAALASPRVQHDLEDDLVTVFRRAAHQHPDRVAVTCEGESLTYAQLLDRAQRLASRLAGLGVAEGELVAVSLDPSTDLPVAIIAILTLGAAYVPLDPEYPLARRTMILESSRPSAVVSSRRSTWATGLPTDLPVVYVDDDHEGRALAEVATPPDRVAYVLYTSGSTGRPKGVRVTQRNVLRLFAAAGEHYSFGPDDVWSMFHSYAFDFSVWEMWGPLLHGGELVVVPRDIARDPRRFTELLRERRVTFLSQTPSALTLLLGSASIPETVREVVLGGEAMEPSLIRTWFAQRDRTARLANMYGITETTVHTTWREVLPLDAERDASPIGVPIDDLGIRLVDTQGRDVPAGVPGEIHVTGAGVALGYLGEEKLTAERFVTDGEGVRWYRSGDLASIEPSSLPNGGDLLYVGRKDRQVKVRGYRIELGDVEAALASHPAVERVVAQVVPGSGGRSALAAWVIGKLGLTVGEVRAYARRLLPTHMVPSRIDVLRSFPLTPNGKVDVRALVEEVSAPEKVAEFDAARTAELTEQERFLSDIWCDITGEEPQPDDTFADVGGDSLAVVEMVVRAEAAGLQVDMQDVFAGRTLRELAGGQQFELERRPSLEDVWSGRRPVEAPVSPVTLIAAGETTSASMPVYVIHWGTGNTSFCRRMDHAAWGGRRVTGVDAVGLRDDSRPLVSLDEVARAIVRRIESDGPSQIHLVGFCYGAEVAVHVAAELVDHRGPEVFGLVLADAAPADPSDAMAAWSVDELLAFRLRMVADRYGDDPVEVIAMMTALGIVDEGHTAGDFLDLQALWASNTSASLSSRTPAVNHDTLLVCSAAHAEDATPAAWAGLLDPARVRFRALPDVPDSHYLVGSQEFGQALAEFFCSVERSPRGHASP